MPNWTPQDLDQYEARAASWIRKPVVDAAPDGQEAQLQHAIRQECKRRGWIALSGSMARKTHRPPGEPDFIILADRGRVFLVECKTRTGKMSMEQLSMQAMASRLGHEVYIVRSLKQFNEIVEGK